MKYLAEYIWQDSSNNLRSKSKTIDFYINKMDNIMEKVLDLSIYDEWECYNYTETTKIENNNQEIVILKPCAVFPDPFRKEPNVLLLCSTYNYDDNPLKNNYRDWSKTILKQIHHLQPLFILEQQFLIMENCPCCPNKISNKPYGFKDSNESILINNEQHYCSIGSNNAFGRKISEQAFHSCLEAGINVLSINSHIKPSQWEIQVGPDNGLNVSDHLLIVRYILLRIGELFNAQICFNNINSKKNSIISTCYINYTDINMLKDIKYVYETFIKLCDNQIEQEFKEKLDIIRSNSSNLDFNQISQISRSIKIPYKTFKDKKGYVQDRRYSANINPYLITSEICENIHN